MKGLAFASVIVLLVAGQASCRTRRYYIQAEQVEWDFAPSGRNLLKEGEPLLSDDDGAIFTVANDDLLNSQIGSKYQMCRYIEYSDNTFTETVDQDPHLGILGPVIRAEVGDEILIDYVNRCPFPTTMHPHGVHYTKEHEGADAIGSNGGGFPNGNRVETNDGWTYNWTVPARAGPSKDDPSSILWMYHSHVDSVAEVNTGLMGPLIITKKRRARRDGSPRRVDKEIITVFQVLDQGQSLLLEESFAAECPNAYAAGSFDDIQENEDFQEGNLMHAINGRVYGNLPGLDVDLGDDVRWYTMALGTEVDMHTPHWHGQTLVHHGLRVDVVNLLPATLLTLTMEADNPGTWLFHCHVNDHISAGMSSLFTVHD